MYTPIFKNMLREEITLRYLTRYIAQYQCDCLPLYRKITIISASKMLLIFNLLVLVAIANAEIVNTGSGSVDGTELLSRDGRKYFAFYGIPYAEPPVGNLRFKNPLPVKTWDGVKNCKEPAQPCIQVQGFNPKYRGLILGKEDCLILNVFTTKLNPDKPLAVLAHTHGGAFMEGASPPPYGAGYFMDEDVVLVTIQYRLGVLGFLSLEDEVLPGNFGFKDQALALAWIKSNIANFGGNPEKITIFGESAGGASAHYHMKSPLSKHLISGAISESGVVNRIWSAAQKDTEKEKAIKVAKMVGCNGSSKEILKCLQKVETETLVKIKNNLFVWDSNPAVPLKPVIEKKGTKGAFITKDPMKITTNIPWITGFTTNEGALVTGSIVVQSKEVLEDFIANIDSYLPHLLNVDNMNAAGLDQTVKLVKEKYFSKLDYESVMDGFEKFVKDGFFVYPMLESLKNHNGPKYVYEFNYRGGSSIIDEFGDQPKDRGVSHVDEILLLFNMTAFFPLVKESDAQVSKNLIKMWTKFAQNGKPSPDWKEWKKGEYLLIEETNSMKKADELCDETFSFWSNLPLYKNRVKTEL